MLLVIDVGNTNTVAGIYDGKKLVDNWRFSSYVYEQYAELFRIKEGAGNGHYHFQRSSSGAGSPVSYV